MNQGIARGLAVLFVGGLAMGAALFQLFIILIYSMPWLFIVLLLATSLTWLVLTLYTRKQQADLGEEQAEVNRKARVKHLQHEVLRLKLQLKQLSNAISATKYRKEHVSHYMEGRLAETNKALDEASRELNTLWKRSDGWI